MAKRLSNDEIKALVQSELRQSLGYNSSKLATARQKSMYYYLGKAVGDLSPPEIDGRSSVVSTDVRDTIEAMLPQLTVTFCGGDAIAEFEAQNPDDEGKASLATEYINYLFFKKNNGHKVAVTWMKDALLQKNGIVKVWWDTRHEETKEEYKALSDVELAQILDDEEIEVIEQNTYPDEFDAEEKAKAMSQLTTQYEQAVQAAQQGNQQAQQAAMQMEQQIAQMQSQLPKMLYDIVCKRVKSAGKIQIDNVPPEEFLISRNAKDIQTARFCAHRVQRTISELKSMGYKNVDNISGDDQSQGLNMERIERLSWNDENAYLSNEITVDDAQKTVWVTEAYIRADQDGDGIVELRKVTVAGNELLDNEEVDYTPFVSITPVPLPHTFYGLSIADLAMESQKVKTSILRSQLDNMYLNVNGRYFAVEGQVNLDDLLTSRPGGVVRIKQPGSVGRLDQGIGNVAESFQLMEYMQQDLENRTGWSRQSMGNDASGLKQTATAANIVTNKADMRVDMVARNFAEGFTELFKLMLKLVCQHQDKEAMVKLSGGWVEIDPREWRNQFDVAINVGIGMGNKDQKVAHLMTLIQQQGQAFQLGIANPVNVYAASTELAKLLGFKNGDKFFTDPSKSPPPNKPDPEQMKVQAQMQLEQMKLQADAQKFQAQTKAEIDKFQAQIAQTREVEQIKAQAKLQEIQASLELQAANDARDSEREQLKASFDAQMEQQRLEFERWKAELDARVKLRVAKIGKEESGDELMEEVNDAEVMDKPNPIDQLSVMHAQTLNAIAALAENMARPKQIVRDANGRAQGVV